MRALGDNSNILEYTDILKYKTEDRDHVYHCVSSPALLTTRLEETEKSWALILKWEFSPDFRDIGFQLLNSS